MAKPNWLCNPVSIFVCRDFVAFAFDRAAQEEGGDGVVFGDEHSHRLHPGSAARLLTRRLTEESNRERPAGRAVNGECIIVPWRGAARRGPAPNPFSCRCPLNHRQGNPYHAVPRAPR